MSDHFDWRRSFSRLRYAHPEDALREIARHLHHHGRLRHGNGRVNPNVLALLAEMIDPDEAKPTAGVKFELKRLKRKAPPVEPDYELRRFLEHEIDVLGRPVKVVVGEAADRFGASRSQCFRDLAVMRDFRKRTAEFEGMLARMRARNE